MRPDPEIPADDLFRKLTAQPQPTEVIDWPRKDSDGNPIARVRIRVLTMVEHDEARLRAHEILTKKKLSKDDLDAGGVKQVYGDMVAREVLAKAIVRENPIGERDGVPIWHRIFDSGEDLNRITADELVVLFQAYQLVQMKYGPYEAVLTDEDVTAWIERLKEGADLLPFARLSLQDLVELALKLARRASTLSEILGSLPKDSLDSSAWDLLQTLGVGTSSRTSPPADQSTTDSETESGESSAQSERPRLAVDDEITIEKAIEIAKARRPKLIEED